MSADYHHLAKVLDLVAALAPDSLIEIGEDESLYTPLIKKYFPGIRTNRKDADLVIFPVVNEERQTMLNEMRRLLKKHRGMIVVASKSSWDKADLAGVAPSLFVNDPSGIIAYLGTTEAIKKLRKTLLRQRMRRQSGVTPTIEAVYRIARRKVK